MAVTVGQPDVARIPLAESRQDLAEQRRDPLLLVIEPGRFARRDVGQPGLDRVRLFLRRESSRERAPPEPWSLAKQRATGRITAGQSVRGL